MESKVRRVGQGGYPDRCLAHAPDMCEALEPVVEGSMMTWVLIGRLVNPGWLIARWAAIGLCWDSVMGKDSCGSCCES